MKINCLKDWLNWFVLAAVAFISYELYGVSLGSLEVDFDILFLSIDFLPAAAVMVTTILIVMFVNQERRWRAFKEFREMILFNGSEKQKFKQLQDYVTEEKK